MTPSIHRRLYFIFATLFLTAGVAVYFGETALGVAEGMSTFFRAGFTGFSVSFAAFVLVDRWLWRRRWFRLIAAIKTPIVHGRWEGNLRSSFTSYEIDYPVVIEFRQTLTKLSVRYYDGRAVTHSRLAGFSEFEAEGSVVVICVYYNNPIVTSERNLQAHSGVMELYFDDRVSQFQGIYYNNPHQRKTYGYMNLRRTSRRLLGRFAGELDV